MFKLLSLVTLVLASSIHADSFFQDKLREARELFPVSYPVDVVVAPLSGDALMGEDLCSLGRGVRFGQTERKRDRHRITISQRLVFLAKSNDRSFSCSHGSFSKLLLATLVHELAHVRDNFERVSLDPDFQRIVGVKRLTRSSKKRLMNQNVEASPDAYEFENLEEALATNVEYLLLDPEYECRRPATAAFLAKKLGLPLKRECRTNYKLPIQSAYLEDNYLHLTSIDPKRVYQVHYLFAGKGKALMSRWGHAMFRLVVCAPHRKTVGPECLRDVSHHLALSYRAYITDMSINYAKGIFGDYPSQLFVLRFHEVQQEYTKFELRDLLSLPLRLTEAQKKEFIDLTLERFWAYQGKYYFLDNNCGTEVQKHLAVALPEELAVGVRSLTPLRLYNDILRRELSSGEAIVMESLHDELEATFRELKAWGLFGEKSFKKFLKKTRAPARFERYARVLPTLRLTSKEHKRLVLRLIYLERYLHSRFTLELPKVAVKKMDKDKELKAQVLKLGEGLKILGVQPWEVINGRYGVPLPDEFEDQWPRFLEERRLAMKRKVEEQLRDLRDLLGGRHFSRELEELEAFEAIKRMTNELILKEANLQEAP